MHWIIQGSSLRENAVAELLQHLGRHGLPFSIVKVIPFGGGIEPEVSVTGPSVVVGSDSLARHARRMGWKPGAWLGRQSEDDFTYGSYTRAFGREMLNADARIVPFSDIVCHELDRFFVRPVTDQKLFAGTVMDRAEAAEWCERIRGADSTWTITPATPILVSTVKPILSETRFVIVDGKVVTGSLYRHGPTVLYGAEIDPHILAFAQERAAVWTPDRVCVMDVADTPDGPRIIEFNNVNSAGWYACDVSKIVQAIEAMT